MKLIFARSERLSSWFIRANTRGNGYTTDNGWSHVAAIIGPEEDQIIDSMAFKGVRKRSLASFTEAFPDHEIMQLDVPNDAAGEEWVLTQIGTKYDYLAYVGIGLYLKTDIDRNWQDESAWFCSELIGTQAAKAGHKFDISLNLLVPNHLHSLCYKI